MNKCKIIYTNGQRSGVTEMNSDRPSQTFQNILNNPQVKNFEEALSIYKNLYSEEMVFEDVNPTIQNSGFFSNAEQALINLKDKNVKNVKGWLKALTDTQKNGGVKNVNQELEWIGLEDYLNEYVKENNPKAGNIPSSVVEDYIKSNQIEIVDVSKGGDFKGVSYQDIDKAELISNDKYSGYYVYYKNGFIDKVYGVDSIDEAIFQSIRESNFAESDSIQPTKYEVYQLKGGENYREVLLTMPNKSIENDKIFTVKNRADFWKDSSNFSAEEIEEGFLVSSIRGGRKLIEKDYYIKTKEDAINTYRQDNLQLLDIFAEEQGVEDFDFYDENGNYFNTVTAKNIGQATSQYKEQTAKKGDEYTSSHWSEKNILAHVRLNEKTLPDGRKVLIINEIQSDWQADGRKKGFLKSDGKDLIAFREEMKQKYGDSWYTDRSESEVNKDNALLKGTSGVANMPYANTDQYLGLAMRKVMQLASQENYDGIAIATGQQSADMYSLARQVDKIEVSFKGMENEERAVYVVMKDNTDIALFVEKDGNIKSADQQMYVGKKIDEVLGKEASVKIMEADRGKIFEGEGLEFGGEGMKTFYDKIVPKVVQKEAQRFDKNAKLETVDFSHKYDLTEANDNINTAKEELKKEGLSEEEIRDINTKIRRLTEYKNSLEEQNSGKYTDKLSLGVQPYIALTQPIKDSVSQGIPLFSISEQADPQLKYQTEDGKIFTDYSQALKNTSGENIKMGFNTVDGFKEVASISSNTSIETTGGFINNMVKSGILSGESYKENGYTHYKPQGRSEAKKKINAEIAKDLFKLQFGIKSATLNIDNSVTVKEEGKRSNVELTTKDGEKVVVSLNEIQDGNFDVETKLGALANKLYKEETQNRKTTTKTELVPENKLQEQLINLLKKFGIKTLSFSDYLDGYSKRNNLPINARALADLTEKVIAFKDGIIENDDLVEEVAHLIEASIPLEQKENILRNIHKTKEWMDNYEAYKDIYATEEELRREILGKVIANSIKEQFATRENGNQTENSIISRIQEFFNQFLDRIRGFFQESYVKELEDINKNIYNNLMSETLELDLSQAQGMLFSVADASSRISRLNESAKKLVSSLRAQEQTLAKRYKNPADKALLNIAQQQLEDAEDAMAITTLVRLASSQTNVLEKKVQEDKLLTSEENVVYQNIKNRIIPALSEVRVTLDAKNGKVEAETIEEIDSIIKKMTTITGKVDVSNPKRLRQIATRAIQRMELSDKDRESYTKILEASLVGVQKDTDFMHSVLGSLLQARNPLLNLGGDIIERAHILSNEWFQREAKELVNSGITNEDLKNIITDDWSIIHEIDLKKEEEYNKGKKIDVINRIVEQLPSIEKVDSETNLDTYFEDLEASDSNKEDIALLQKQFGKEWAKELKSRRESYFTKEYVQRLDTHAIEINGKTISKETVFQNAIDIDDHYKAQSTQIMINAGGNLTKADHEARRQISKNRTVDANPREADGSLKKGIIEVYDEKNSKWVLDYDSKSVLESLSEQELFNIDTIIGLNQLSYIKQDFFKGQDKKDIPDAFIEELNKLTTVEEQLEFIENNSFISFPDQFYENFKNNTGLIDRLREVGTEEADDIITEIRVKQSIINRVLRANSVYNKPGDTNFSEMHSVAMDEIKLAQMQLEELYSNAKNLLPEQEVENLIQADNTTNTAYDAHLEDSGENELDFILKHVTLSGASSIKRAKDIIEGKTKMTKAFEKHFASGLTEENLIKYAKTKLLPYLKRTEPIGYTEMMEDVKNEIISVEQMLERTDLIKVNPSFAYYERIDENINPKWLDNRDAGREQWTEDYINEVKDDKFNSTFNVVNGEATTNIELWEKRKALLNYYDKMIEYNGLTGNQSRYMYPGVRRTQVERVAGTTVKGAKEMFIDMLQFRPEEKETGEMVANSLYTIPTYYNTPLKEEEEHTKNYLYAFMMYGKAATVHKSHQESIGDMLVIGDTLEKTEFKDKARGASNAYKMFKNFMEYNYYGKKENFSMEFTLGNRTLDVGKILKTLNSYAKKVNLAGLVTPLTNVFQGTIQKNMERVIGETINSIASNRGNKMYMKYAPESMKEVMAFKSNAVMNVIGESLGIFNMVHRYEDSQYSKTARFALNGNSKIHEAANFAVVSRGVMGIIADYRIVDGKILSFNQFKQRGGTKLEWQKYENFDTYFYGAVQNGVLDFNSEKFIDSLNDEKGNSKIIPHEGQTIQEYLQDKKLSISERTLAFTQRIDSQIPMHQKSVWARDARANFFLSHLNYLLVAIPNKFKEKHFNLAEDGMEQEGSWRSTGRFLKNIISDPKNIREIYNNSTVNEKQNMRRTMMEFAYANALALVALILSNYNDEDDDPAYALALADLFATRVATEQIGSTVALPKSALSVFDSPLMLKSKMEDWADVTKLGGTDKQRDSYIKKLLPFYKELERFEDPLTYRKSYQHFQSDDKKLFYNYAFASRYFKKDGE